MLSFHHLVNTVNSLKPGQQITYSEKEFSLFQQKSPWAPHHPETDQWPTADRVLGSIMGSNYEWWYQKDVATGDITFGRLEKPVSDEFRSFVEPDRLYLFDRLSNGLYRRNNVEFRPRRGA